MRPAPVHDTKKPFRIILLGARPGTGNMGVGALAMGALTAAKHAFPDAELAILEYDDERCLLPCCLLGRSIDVPLINIRFSKNVFLPNHILRLLLLAALVRLVPFKPLRSLIMRHNSWFADAAGTDLCLSIAGGDSFADIYGVGRFFYVALPQFLFLLLKIPLVQMPQTYGPFKNRAVRRVAAWIIAKSRAVFSRDRAGMDLVRELQGNARSVKTAAFSPDVGFLLEPRRPKTLDVEFEALLDHSAGNLVGINVSGLLWMGGYTRNNMFGLAISYPDFTRRLVRYFTTTRGVTVLLVPHVVAVGKSREADDGVCRELYDELKDEAGERLLLPVGPFDQNEIKYYIGKTSFFIGARMHACIAALSQSIPAVGVAYSKKFEGVMAGIGFPELVVDPMVMTEDDLMREIAALYDRRAAITAALKAAMPKVKSDAINLLKEFRP